MSVWTPVALLSLKCLEVNAHGVRMTSFSTTPLPGSAPELDLHETPHGMYTIPPYGPHGPSTQGVR